MGKIFKFWGRVLLRYWETAKSVLDLRGFWIGAAARYFAVVGITWLATRWAVATPLVKSVTEDWQGYFKVVPYLVVGLIILLAYNLLSQPAKMYDELGGFAERKMRVLFECKPRRYSEAWAGLRIYNDHPRLPITQCYTYFKKIVDLSDGSNVLKRPGEKLSWTNSDPPINGDKDINPLGNRHPDILMTDNANNRIIFCTQGNPDLYRDKAGIGNYQIVIGVWGVFEGTAFDEEVEFTLDYKGAWDIECNPIRELHVGKSRSKK